MVAGEKRGFGSKKVGDGGRGDVAAESSVARVSGGKLFLEGVGKVRVRVGREGEVGIRRGNIVDVLGFAGKVDIECVENDSSRQELSEWKKMT